RRGGGDRRVRVRARAGRRLPTRWYDDAAPRGTPRHAPGGEMVARSSGGREPEVARGMDAAGLRRLGMSRGAVGRIDVRGDSRAAGRTWCRTDSALGGRARTFGLSRVMSARLAAGEKPAPGGSTERSPCGTESIARHGPGPGREHAYRRSRGPDVLDGRPADGGG